MVANVSTDAQSIAREFARLIRDEPTVTQLWLAYRQEDLELLVMTDGAGVEDELRIADAFGELIDRHPEVNIIPRMLDPHCVVSKAALAAAIPKRASQVPLRD